MRAIQDQLAEVRERASVLTDRVREVRQHTAEVRSTRRVSCNHAEQVADLQQAVEALEHELDGLHTAMQTRGVIEQAKGMLMIRHHCDAETAFETLVHLSQTSHRKLVDVAQAMVTTWAERDDGEA